MKLVSWNVNGLRACIQKGFLDVFQTLNADFFCLQETKLSEGQLQLELPGYEQYWCYAEKKGYSGTAIFTRHSPLSVQYGIGVPELDNEGRVITLEYKEFYLVTCYTPNAQRELARINHRMTWDEAFRHYLHKLDASKPVILCGDLNVAHKEIDLKNPAANRNNAGFSDQERESFQKTLDLGFTDTFRHIHPDKTGAYSWWSYMFKAREKNAGWRIDYFLVSDRIAGNVYRADIHSDILGSDHCPVSIDLDLTVNGGIFSPESIGTPRVIDPVSTSKKQTKSSPISGKDFASIIPIAALLLVFVVGISLFMPRSPSTTPEPNVTFPPAGEISFDVQIYYTPLTHVSNISIYDVADANNTARSVSSSFVLQDDTATYYTSGVEGLDTANVFLRVSNVEQNLIADPQYWNLTLTPMSWKLSPNGAVESVDLNELTIEPYCTDPGQTHFGGWLVWGNVTDRHWTHWEFGLTVTCNTGLPSPAFTTKVQLYPFISHEIAHSLPTELLMNHIIHHPVISQLVGVKDNPALSIQNPFGVAYEALEAQYPCLTVFSTREDCISALMTASDQPELCRLLLYHNTYRSKMTPEEEYRFLTQQYPAATPLEFFHTDTALWALSTKEILDYAIHPLQILAQCTSQESVDMTYSFLLHMSPALQALESRHDAISLIMEDKTFRLYFGLMDVPGSFYAMSTVCDYLLSQPAYRDRMTPEEEAKYISGLYPNGISKDFSQTHSTSDINRMGTHSLLNYLIERTEFDEHLLRTSSLESAYQLFLLEKENNPYLNKFYSKEDAVFFLEVYGSVETDPSQPIYLAMHDLWLYISKRQVADFMTNDQLMEEIWQLDTRDPITTQFIPMENIAPNDPYISALLSREGAVDYLMNCPVPNQYFIDLLPYRILDYVRERMTPRQQALMITGHYPSYFVRFTFSLNSEKDPTTMSTQEIVEYLDKNGSDIVTHYFWYTDDYEVKAEIYRILRQYSNLLQELETRPDAVKTLFQACSNTINDRSPLGDLRYIYRDYLPLISTSDIEISPPVDEST